MGKKLLFSLIVIASSLTDAMAGVKTYCLTNSYGEQATLSLVGKAGPGLYNIAGDYDYQPLGGTIWPVTGMYNKNTGELHFVARNPSGEDCAYWADSVTFDYVMTGSLTFSGTFSNNCGNFGSVTASAAAGSCGFNAVVMKKGEYGTTGNHSMMRSQLPVPAGVDLMKSLSNSVLVSPNPITSQAVINVTVATPTKVTLNIYNQSGMLVRIVESGIVSEGTHTYTWNLQTQSGTKVKSGLYTVKLITEDGAESTQILVTQ